jgi:hydroxymethylbilane synthase
MNRIVIGTRGSDLARLQSGLVADLLKVKAGLESTFEIISTKGDKFDRAPFSDIPGKGFFTKEIEDALLSRTIDVAVHSMKDLPTELPSGLKIGAVCLRENPGDVIVAHREVVDDSHKLGIRDGIFVGTSSVRRQSQIAAIDPRLKIRELRGNIPTRVSRLREGQYDAIVIASAGIDRLKLDMGDLSVIRPGSDILVPAPAQGILAVEIRADDADVEEAVSAIDDHDIRTQVELERGLLECFAGGCQLPLGAISFVTKDGYRLRAALGIKSGDGWAGVRKADVGGSEIESVIKQAYDELIQS